MNKSLMVEELGRTQTVKDAQRAYELIFEANRKFAVRMKQARENAERKQAEVAVFLDDMRHITGLTFESKLFWRIVGLTLDIRLRRHNIATEDTEWREFCGPLAEGFDLGDDPASLQQRIYGLPSNDDIADALCKADPELKKYRGNLI